jgi:peptide/nickel transport system permease protein
MLGVSAADLIRRLIYAFVTVFAVVTLTFVLFRMLPADPTAMMIDPLTDPARREVLREQLGLNEPLIVQYFSYWGDVFRGNLGTSYQSRQPVVTTVVPAFVNSAVLAVVIFALAYSLGSIFGALSAWYRGSLLERSVVNIGLVFRGAPPYFVGILLIMVFAIGLGWLPSGGMRSSFTAEGFVDKYLNWDFVQHLILPAVTGAVYTFTTPLLITRNAMLDSSRSEYIELARAKGLSESKVLFKHGYRNALLPLLAEGSQFFAYAIGGMVAIEVVFSWPGLGRLIVDSLVFRDFPVAQASFMLIGILVVITYLASDVLAAWLDPRARSTERARA